MDTLCTERNDSSELVVVACIHARFPAQELQHLMEENGLAGYFMPA
jgi:hypothetical protein